jgi:hypothetical protein
VSYAKCRVEVHERLDGRIAVFHHGSLLQVIRAPLEATTLRARGGHRLPAPASSRSRCLGDLSAAPDSEAASRQITQTTANPRAAKSKWTPPANHPWRHYKRPPLT